MVSRTVRTPGGFGDVHRRDVRRRIGVSSLIRVATRGGCRTDGCQHHERQPAQDEASQPVPAAVMCRRTAPHSRRGARSCQLPHGLRCENRRRARASSTRRRTNSASPSDSRLRRGAIARRAVRAARRPPRLRRSARRARARRSSPARSARFPASSTSARSRRSRPPSRSSPRSRPTRPHVACGGSSPSRAASGSSAPCAPSSRRRSWRTSSRRSRSRTPRRVIVHIVRDGRDVVCSLLEKPWLRREQAEADDAGVPYGAYARFWVEPERREEFETASDARRAAWVWRSYVDGRSACSRTQSRSATRR